MSGQFTGLTYDKCAYTQELKQSTQPLEWELDLNRYVNVNNFAGYHSGGFYPYNALDQVDIDSSLKGLDTISSNCSGDQQPFCYDKGCINTFDPRYASVWSPPDAYQWKHSNDPNNPGVVSTNMNPPSSNGIPYYNDGTPPCAYSPGALPQVHANNVDPNTAYGQQSVRQGQPNAPTAPQYQIGQPQVNAQAPPFQRGQPWLPKPQHNGEFNGLQGLPMRPEMMNKAWNGNGNNIWSDTPNNWNGNHGTVDYNQPRANFTQNGRY